MRVFSFLFIALWVAADQALKLYTVNNLSFNQVPETIIPSVLALTYALNKGAAWSLFWGQLGFLTALRFLVGLVILGVLVRSSVKGWSRFALALIAAGAFGNAIDGFLRDGVVDMLILWPLTTVYRAITGSPYPIFNLADIGVVSGALVMIASSFFAPKVPERPLPAGGTFEFKDSYVNPGDTPLEPKEAGLDASAAQDAAAGLASTDSAVQRDEDKPAT